ncbi:MAG: hypothetical protein AB7I38_03770 [Dehalococcoidia bacterium]
MTAADRRLRQLVTNLSARERALWCVEAALDGRAEDPLVRGLMPGNQVTEFNTLVSHANAVLHVLWPGALLLTREVEALRLRYLLFLSLSAWEAEQAARERLLAQLLPATASDSADDAAVTYAAPSQTPHASLDGDMLPGGAASDAVTALTRVLQDEIHAGFQSSWSEMLALETVIGEVTDVFGQDSVIPETLRVTLDAAQSDLRVLRNDAAPFLELQPTAAEASLTDRLRWSLLRDARLYG